MYFVLPKMYKMKIFYLILILSISDSIMAQPNLTLGTDYKIEIDPISHIPILVGEVDEQVLESTPGLNWYEEGKATYAPDSAAISIIQKYINEYDIVAVLGTWCGDSHYLFPKFMKVLEDAGQDSDRIKMYTADRSKNALNMEKQLYSIERLPTFIFYKNNNEKGRIVESIEEPIEIWMAKFLGLEAELGSDN